MDVAGTWRDLTESVNEMAGNLTRQVRAIARGRDRGDPRRPEPEDRRATRPGEIPELQDYINKMIANLRETTLANKEQDWLKGNLARISALMQGRRDLDDVASLIMSELTPLVAAQHGAFFLAMPTGGRRRRSAYELRHARLVRLLDGLHADVVPARRGAGRARPPWRSARSWSRTSRAAI